MKREECGRPECLDGFITFIYSPFVFFCQLDASWKHSCLLWLLVFFITFGYNSPLSSGVLTFLLQFLTYAYTSHICFLLSAFIPTLTSTFNSQNPYYFWRFCTCSYNGCNSPPPPPYCRLSWDLCIEWPPSFIHGEPIFDVTISTELRWFITAYFHQKTKLTRPHKQHIF